VIAEINPQLDRHPIPAPPHTETADAVAPPCCEDEAHEWELVRWRRGLGGTEPHPVLRCTRCGQARPATARERSWMSADL